MTAFTITTEVNIDSLAVKAGGDTYAINGGILNIDQDTRYGVNSVAAAAMGSITISSTLGGTLNIDGRYVRLIAFTGGSGTVPASNTTISQGSASGLLIGVWSDLVTAPLAAGAAMPASGYIKIKAWNSVAFTSGALTGITATSSGVDIVGWIDVVGAESVTLTVPRLGSFNATGEWYDLGTTSGSNASYYQIPTSGVSAYHPGVFVETAVGSDTYEFYPNAGALAALSTVFSTDWRAKLCWIATDGKLRFANDGTNSSGGYTPIAGCKLRMGNVFLHNAAAADRTTNAIPHATIASRYETLTTSAGVLNLEKVSCGWYINCSQAYSLAINNSGIFDTVVASEIATPMIWSQVGIGVSNTLSTYGIIMSLNFAGGTFTDCLFTRYAATSTSNYVMSMADIANFTFTRLRTLLLTAVRGNASTGAMSITRGSGLTFNEPTLGGGKSTLITCNDVNFNNTTYFDNILGNTISTNGAYCFELSSSCVRIKIDGVDFGDLYMCGPYNGILSIGAAGCKQIKLRNLGTYASPLDLGSPRKDDVSWSRVTITATVTDAAHGFIVGDTIYVVVSSATAAITTVAKTITAVPTVDTFSFVCLNNGATSGTLSYFGTKCANVFVLATGAAADDVKVQHVYVPHTRTNLYTADNSSKNLLLENVFSDYLNIPLMAGLNMFTKNVSGTPTLAVQTAVYGTHWWNGYTCDVAENTVDCAWTRSGTTVTVISAAHSLRTTTASTSTAAQNIPISIITSSDEAAIPRGVQNTVTVLTSSTFNITGINAGATSGTLSYRVGNGRIGIVMNESTTETSDQVSFDSGNPKFTSAGTLYMPTIGDQVTFTSPDYILGQGSTFPIMELQLGGSTLTRYDFKYAIDKNDGSSFGSFHNLYYERSGGSGSNGAYTFTVTDATGVEIDDYVWGTGVANKTKVTDVTGNTITVDSPNINTVSGIIRFNHLPSESGLGPDTGIKMKWRITTKTTNTVGINFMYIFSESTVLGRSYQYQLDSNTITFTGLPTGCDAVVLSAGTTTILDQEDSIAGTSYSYVYSGAQTVDVGFIKPGYKVKYIRGLSLSTIDTSIPIELELDRNYV